MSDKGDNKKTMLILAIVFFIFGIMGLIMITFLETHVFGSSFGKANHLKYGLVLLAVVAAVVGGYFLLKKHEGKTSGDEELMNEAYAMRGLICWANAFNNLDSTPELKRYAQGQGNCKEYLEAYHDCRSYSNCGKTYNQIGGTYIMRSCMAKCTYKKAPFLASS